jgi:PTH1 family peptidyl-tRNA hydrolase
MKKLIVGLGNPGSKYSNSRHNAGFMAVDHIATQFDSSGFTKSSQADALCTDAIVEGEKVKFAKPQTFMNKSGQAVWDLADYFDISSDDILVIHDDIALHTGELRVSFASSSGGHNGVQSVISCLDTKDFTRLRMGIKSKSQNKQKATDISTRSYVLSTFTDEQKETIKDVLPQAETAVRYWVKKGYQAAMNAVN